MGNSCKFHLCPSHPSWAARHPRDQIADAHWPYPSQLPILQIDRLRPGMGVERKDPSLPASERRVKVGVRGQARNGNGTAGLDLNQRCYQLCCVIPLSLLKWGHDDAQPVIITKDMYSQVLRTMQPEIWQRWEWHSSCGVDISVLLGSFRALPGSVLGSKAWAHV